MHDLIKREGSQVSVNEVASSLTIIEDVIMEGYIRVLKDSDVPPSVHDVIKRTRDVIDEKAYDIIYGEDIIRLITADRIVSIMNEQRNVIVFIPGQISNNSQQMLFENLYDEIRVDV